MRPDWLPKHCMHCMTYTGHDEHYRRPCPDECDCGHAAHSASHVCPTCGHKWMGVPPEDWDGSLLVRAERPVPTPPPEHVDSNEVSV